MPNLCLIQMDAICAGREEMERKLNAHRVKRKSALIISNQQVKISLTLCKAAALFASFQSSNLRTTEFMPERVMEICVWGEVFCVEMYKWFLAKYPKSYQKNM